MSKPVRLTAEKKQERISRKQFCERLDEFDWIASRPDEDLGEDFIVHIYHQGQATGVTFHVQLKSITNLHKRRKDDFLVYDGIEVKDLKHWEDFSQPVVLVVWDVKLREGRWALVEDLIANLDQKRPEWRKNKTKARVRIPWRNTTDDAGLKKLTRNIYRKTQLQIFQKTPIEQIRVQFTFPDSEEGRATGKALEHSIKEGEPITTKGFISNFKLFPEKLMHWHSDIDPKSITFSLGTPTSSPKYSAYVDITNSTGRIVSIPPVEFKVVKSGTEVTQLSNEHQDSPLGFQLTIRSQPIDNKTVTLAITLNHIGRIAYETEQIQNFLGAIAEGGILNLRPLTENNTSVHETVSFSNIEREFNPQILSCFNKVALIQEKTGHFIRFPKNELRGKDIRAIDELVEIVTCGKSTVQNIKVTGEFQKKALQIMLDVHRQGKPIHLTVSTNESFVELFDSKIQAGRMTRHITGTLEMLVTELEEAITALAPGEYLAVKLVDAEIVEIFPDWYIREAERLSQLLIEDFEAKAVYLFGSLAWSDIHAPETDIDLAVSGLPPERYLEAVGYLERESNFPVDLVELEKVSDHLRKRILAEGKLLSEREPAITPG